MKLKRTIPSTQKHPKTGSLRNSSQRKTAIESLVSAARNGDKQTIQRLIALGVPVAAKAADGRDALLASAEAGHTDAVCYLIGNNADIEARVSSPENVYRHAEFTPLMLASWNGHDATVRALLIAGANPNAQYSKCGSAMSCAIHNGHISVIRTLLKAGAKLPFFALYRPVATGNLRAVRELIKLGADLNYRTDNGAPLLVIAAKNAGEFSPKVIDLLLKAGADIDSKEGEQTALMRAIHVGAVRSALHLIARGANINHCDRSGRNALLYAVDSGELHLVEALLKAGADVSISDRLGDNAFKLAKRNRDRAMVALLSRMATG